MILNLIHRYYYNPEDVDTFKFQQALAHSLNLKTTVLITSSALRNKSDNMIERLINDSQTYNDELGLWLEAHDNAKPKHPWLLEDADKEISVKEGIDSFKTRIGYYPRVVANYVLDAHLIKMIKDYCPDVVTVVAGCFEEGTRVFHGCNNSWYLFSEGMSWNPWYPSKTHALRPAENEQDWSGVVALPHLSRDLALAYESRNDFFASHPANAQRGLVNEGASHIYDYNLIDQYRYLEDFNDGFSYYQVHVSAGWLNNCKNVVDDNSVTQQIYRETLEYLKELKDKGLLNDMYMSEFGEYYKQHIPFEKQTVGVGKEMLFGTGKHYFWVYNPYLRILIDANQGGSIGDLRPYAAKFSAFCGPDSPMLAIHSYPYLIQSQLRSGVNHHSSDGSRTTLYITYKDEKTDLCFYPCKIKNVKRENNNIFLHLTPIKICFSDGLSFTIATMYEFNKNGEIYIHRKIGNKTYPDAQLQLCEYFKGCFGFTEYPENMKNIKLYTDNKTIKYEYKGNIFNDTNSDTAGAIIPDINTNVSLTTVNLNAESTEIIEGTLFNPYYTLKVNYAVSDEKEVITCVKLIQK